MLASSQQRAAISSCRYCNGCLLDIGLDTRITLRTRKEIKSEDNFSLKRFQSMSYKVYIPNFLLEVNPCCARFLVPNFLLVVATDQDPGAGLVETLLMLTGCGMSGQPSLASSRHPVKVDMWSWVLRRHTSHLSLISCYPRLCGPTLRSST